MMRPLKLRRDLTSVLKEKDEEIRRYITLYSLALDKLNNKDAIIRKLMNALEDQTNIGFGKEVQDLILLAKETLS